MADTLKVPIDVDIARAQYTLSRLKGRLRDTGQAGKTAGTTMGKSLGGAIGLARKLAGPLALGAVARAWIEVKDNAAAAGRKMDEALTAQGKRLENLALTVNTQLARTVRDVTGIQPMAQERFARRWAGRYGLTQPDDWRYAANVIGARIASPKAGPAGAKRFHASVGDIGALANVAGLGGTEAANLFAMLYDQFGITDPKKMREEAARLVIGARESAWTTPQFMGEFPGLASTLKMAGYRTPMEQLGLFGGMSVFEPTRPGVGAKGLQRLLLLAMRKGGDEESQRAYSRMMRKAGVDPRTRHVPDILKAIKQYVNVGKTDAERASRAFDLAEMLQLRMRLIKSVAQTTTGEFEAKQAKVISRGMAGGWSTGRMWGTHDKPEIIEEEMKENLARPGAGRLKDYWAGRMKELEEPVAGGRMEVADVIRSWDRLIEHDPGYEERVLAYKAAWEGIPGKGPAGDLQEEMVKLNIRARGVLEGLAGVCQSGASDTLKKEARDLYMKITYARRHASTASRVIPLLHHLYAQDPATYVDKYRTAIRRGLAFLMGIRRGDYPKAIRQAARPTFYTRYSVPEGKSMRLDVDRDRPIGILNPRAALGEGAAEYEGDAPVQYPGAPGARGEFGALGVGGTVILSPANVYLNTPGERARNTLTKAGP